MTASEIQKKTRKLGSKEKAAASQRFFKTNPGQYGEGDLFIGISVPDLRKLAAEYQHITPDDVLQLLESPFHEERLLALLILVRSYSKADELERKAIYDLYMKNRRYINNWDLVDASAHHIVGHFLMDKSREPLYALARSSNLWERRISIVSTFYYIRRGRFSDTLKISKILLDDKEDLIQKAVGWMLREVGKRDIESEEGFLREHYRQMPRTMLRYAIERFDERKRQEYLKGLI